MPTPPPDPQARKDAPPTRFETQPTSALPTAGATSGAGGGALSLQAGARPLPDYELVRKLGAGGFGEVWHARGPGGMDVALKFIKLGGKGGTLEVRALEMMKSIRHANLVSLFGVWQKDDLLILAMELCDRTLHDRLKEALAQGLPGVPLTELLGYMRDAAAGLDALHAKQVQHRDVKPLNLFLLAGSVKVADFGLAKLLEQTVNSHTGAMSPAYAAPEFMKGQVSQHSDQYCLAVTYYELRTGRLPFGGSIHQVMYGHLEQPPDLTCLEGSERDVLARALAKDPEKRWPSCRAFVNALIAAARGAGSKPNIKMAKVADAPTAVVVPERTERQAASTSARRLWLGMAAALCVGLLVLCAAGGIVVSLLISKSGGRTTTEAARGGVESLPATMTIDLGDGVTMDFVLIDPATKEDKGVFQMGAPIWEKDAYFDEKPQHRVTLTKPYYLGRFPVTQEQYVKLTGKDNPSYFSRTGDGNEKVLGMNTNHFPVEEVSWGEAYAFCQELTRKHGGKAPAALRNYRFTLPTEAQWEYACRAGTTTAYFFGDDPKRLGDYAWYSANAGARTHRVGTTGANAWGLHDMHGNVWQWCQDYFDGTFYSGGDMKDPVNLKKNDDDRRVLRGGSWVGTVRVCRSACRIADGASLRHYDVGFRVAYRAD
jgi:formylglycine-generating enzyme required for sulfatase activity